VGGKDSWLVRRWAQDHRFMATGGGTSVAAYEEPLRKAAAAARAVLAMAAAARWNVGWEQCEVSGGAVRHGGRTLGFGALVEDAARLTPPDPPVLRPAPAAESSAAFPVGAELAFPRLDAPAKVDGSWQFAGDIRLPDMLYAAIRHAPRGENIALGAHDAAKARGVPGFVRLVEGPRWVAAVAGDWWAAEKALGAIAPGFAVDKPLESAGVAKALDEAIKGDDTYRMVALGDADGILGDHPQFSARYDMAPALHATLETATATARLRDGLVEVWAAVQAPERTRLAIARELAVPAHKVVLYPVSAGGSFDARFDARFAIQAATIAQAAGKPVQLMWSRWQEHVAGLPRAPMVAHMAARADTAGRVAAWRAKIAMPATMREFGMRMLSGASPSKAAKMQDRKDVLAMEGANPPYAIAHVAVDHAPVAISLPTGQMRGGPHAMHAFVTESFLDEIAAALGREPVSFRMGMLDGDARLAACLQRVSALAGWNGGKDGSGAGLACHRMGDVASGGCIAVIATARRSDAGVRVDRITAVADIGRIINADIARQQIEGGLIYGIGLAIGAGMAWRRGLPTTGRLGQLGLPLLADCPEVEVELIASGADPFDPGELGVAVAAPAIANALFSATGIRLRRLPLASDEVE
jgi:isoquinoline 1-oxidoreductase beta subunit